MAARKVNADIRLQKAIESRTKFEFLWRKKRYDVGLTGSPPNFEDPKVWQDFARAALELRPKDKKLKTAFNTFCLDPADPRSWRELLDLFTELLPLALPVERKRGGRKPTWNAERRAELVRAVFLVKTSFPKFDDSEACDRLFKAPESPAYFRSSTPMALKRQLVEGRAQMRRRAVNKNETVHPSAVGRRKKKT